jgi:DnaJ-class molecular chaperone
MQKEERIIDIWVTKDGQEFKNEEDAKFHENFLNGKYKTCPECEGIGKVDIYGDDRVYTTCDICNGKGYLTKKIVWS